MRHYRIMAAAVAAICTLSGCGVQIGRNESMTAPEKTSVVTTTKKQTNDDSKADEQALKSYEETKIVANATVSTADCTIALWAASDSR